jgi:hypothetical protein
MQTLRDTNGVASKYNPRQNPGRIFPLHVLNDIENPKEQTKDWSENVDLGSGPLQLRNLELPAKHRLFIGPGFGQFSFLAGDLIHIKSLNIRTTFR